MTVRACVHVLCSVQSVYTDLRLEDGDLRVCRRPGPRRLALPRPPPLSVSDSVESAHKHTSLRTSAPERTMSASAPAAAACSCASDCGMSRCSTACRRRRKVASDMFGCAARLGGAGRGLSLGGARIRRRLT
jgi:hypothetical protein